MNNHERSINNESIQNEGYFKSLKPSSISFDARRFKRLEVLFANPQTRKKLSPIQVFQYPNGDRIVFDGHTRLALCIRDGIYDFPIKVYRQGDSYTDADGQVFVNALTLGLTKKMADKIISRCPTAAQLPDFLPKE